MHATPVELSAIAPEHEDRRQRQQQQGERKPSGLQGGLESIEQCHASEAGVMEGEISIGGIILYQLRRTRYRGIRMPASLERVRPKFDLPNAVDAVVLPGCDLRDAVLRKINAGQALAVE